jgi:SAM-dependent methyltransferase
MNNKKILLKKVLSYFPYIDRILRNIFNKYFNGSFIIPLNLDQSPEKILQSKSYKLNRYNYEKLKKKYNFFLISGQRSMINYSKNNLNVLISLIKNQEADIAYDGNDFFNTEVSSVKVLDYYNKNYLLDNYPYKFFYIRKKFNVKNIGSEHRSFNFNGSFKLPSGGKTIGDQGDITNRLNFIPNLSGKTFLDIGSEEGYAVFNAINKGAKFAKGLNIEEEKEYDFFPEYKRSAVITNRERTQIDITQKFLIKEYSLEKNDNIKFDYNNIYKLSEEKFDFVFCFGVLYHLKNPYLALENLYKITKETLVLETQGIKNDKYLNAKIGEDDGFIRHSSNSLVYLLEKVGFRKVEVLVDAYRPSTLMSIVLKAEK